MARRRKSRPKDKNYRYKGLLAKPLDPFSDTDPAEQIDSRLNALMDKFAIDAGDAERFKRLALALAFTHVPAFWLPTKWPEFEGSRGPGERAQKRWSR
jgi:hypothetical protein